MVWVKWVLFVCYQSLVKLIVSYFQALICIALFHLFFHMDVGTACGDTAGHCISNNNRYEWIFLRRTFKPGSGPSKALAEMSSHEWEGMILIRFVRFSVSLHRISSTSSFLSDRNALLAFKRQNGMIKFRRSRLNIACISQLVCYLISPEEQLICNSNATVLTMSENKKKMK